MIQKDILRRLLAGFYFLPFSVFLLCLTRYPYRVKELLVCWLFFCSLFAVLAFMLLAAVLACYAGHSLVNWVRAANTVIPDLVVIPELVVCLAELPHEAISGQGILVAGTLKTAPGPYASVDALGARSCPLIEAAPLTEDSVPK